jgi:hypothetical protein
MSGHSLRDLLSIGLIAVALTAGFVVLVNGSCDHEYALKSAQLEKLSDELRNEPDAGALATLRQRAASMLSQVDVSSSISNETTLYDRLMELGEMTDVRIDRVDPVRTGGASSKDGESRSFGANIVAVGTYEAIARFINAIEAHISYSTVIRFDLSLVSSQGEGLVRGNVETRHLRLDEETIERVASVNTEVE